MLFRDEDEDLEVPLFVNRREAGRMLAAKLLAYADRNDVIVLGLPRGGVPVASAVAGALHLSLDVFVVSKLGSPWSSELAMGAVAEGGVQILDLSLVEEICVSEEEIQQVTAAARRELEMRERLYRDGRPPLELAGKTIILVDDGIATGCSILAAIAAIVEEGPCESWLLFLSLQPQPVMRSGWKQTNLSAWQNRSRFWQFRNGTRTSARSAMRMCATCWEVRLARCHVLLESSANDRKTRRQ